YYFILDALDYTIEHLGPHRQVGEARHVGGREVVEGARELAAQEFGPMAQIVFKRWGISRTEDVGELVFNLIEIGLLSRRAEDTRLDFVDGFDFGHAFEQKYRERLAAISASDVLLD
ncbi:MAG: Minf_1886 family protein, partial [Planctomycetota bacterium]